MPPTYCFFRHERIAWHQIYLTQKETIHPRSLAWNARQGICSNLIVINLSGYTIMYCQCSLKVLEYVGRTGEVVVLCVLALYVTDVAWTRNKASAEFLHLMSLMWVLHIRRSCGQSNHLLMCNLRGSEPGAVTAEMLRPPKLNFYHVFIFTFFFFANINKKKNSGNYNAWKDMLWRHHCLSCCVFNPHPGVSQDRQSSD